MELFWTKYGDKKSYKYKLKGEKRQYFIRFLLNREK